VFIIQTRAKINNLERLSSPPRPVFEKTSLNGESADLYYYESPILDSTMFMGVSGGSAMEKSSRLAIAVQKHLLGANGATPLIRGGSGICARAIGMGYSSCVIDALDTILRPSFQIPDYGRIVDKTLDRIFDQNKKQKVIATAESMGGLALMEAIINRLMENKPIPNEVFLVNFPIGGLNPLSVDFLRRTGQLGVNAVPAMHQLMRDSDYLTKLRQDFLDSRGNLPFIVAFAGDCGEDAIASPWGITKDPKVLEVAKRYDTKGGDGIFELDGMVLTHTDQGGTTNLTDSSRTLSVKMNGSVHANGMRYASPHIIKYLRTGILFGYNMAEMAKMLSDEDTPAIIDCSSFSGSFINRAAEVGMKIIAKTMYRS